MTAIGVVCDPQHAMMWADTEIYRAGRAVGHMAKMASNLAACIVGCGAGWAPLIRDANRAVAEAPDLHDLVAEMPHLLRQRAAQVAEHHPDPSSFSGNCYVLAGWAPRYRRVAAYVFEASTFFTPEPAASFASPFVADLAAMNAESFSDLDGVFIEQVAEIERARGHPIGGKIVGALLVPHAITSFLCGRLDDEPHK